MQQQERYDEKRRDVWRYALLNPKFYEPLDRYQARNDLVQLVEPLIPIDWSVRQIGIWQQVLNPFNKVRIQGWKIHVSATLSNCEEILKIAASICIRHSTAFKFACDKWMLIQMNSRRWNRGGAGKFMTIYPASDDDFENLLKELYIHLKDFEGPYILSDIRYKNCKVLYYRYGAITGLDHLSYDGSRIPMIVYPDGIPKPDIRTPYFNPPNWVTDPCKEKEKEEDVDPVIKDGKYVIIQALAFSNAGGVYLAFDAETGQGGIFKSCG